MTAWHLQARGPGWELRDDADRLIGRLSEIESRHARWIAGSYVLLVRCRDLFRARRNAGYLTGDEEDALDAINALLRRGASDASWPFRSTSRQVQSLLATPPRWPTSPSLSRATAGIAG